MLDSGQKLEPHKSKVYEQLDKAQDYAREYTNENKFFKDKRPTKDSGWLRDLSPMVPA